MILFHLLLSIICLGTFGTTLYFKFVEADLLYHFYFGLIAAVTCLVCHCWVFFYFIGTGEGIREGVNEFSLEASAIKRTKRFKGKTFPFAFFSMVFVIVTAILGGGVRFGKVGLIWHTVFSVIAILFNSFTFYWEQKVIRENETLMKTLNEQIESKLGS